MLRSIGLTTYFKEPSKLDKAEVAALFVLLLAVLVLVRELRLMLLNDEITLSTLELVTVCDEPLTIPAANCL